MFSLRFFAPFIFILLVIAGFFHFIWLPKYVDLETEAQLKHEHGVLVLIGEAVISSLLSSDYAEVHSVIDQVLSRHESLENIQLVSADGSLLYPLFEIGRNETPGITRIKHRVIYRGEEIAALSADVNVAKYIEHEIEEVKELEIIVIGLLLLLIIISAYMQYLWVNVPLQRLAKVTDKIAKGDYEEKLPKGISKDLSAFIQSFELMRENLKRREKQLKRQREIENTIRDIQTYFITVQDKFLTFQKILDHIIYLTGSQIGLIGEIGSDNSEPYLDIYAITNLAWDMESRKMYERSIEGSLRFSCTENLFGAVVSTGQVVISGSPKDDSRSGGFPEGHPELKNFLGVPLYNSKSRLMGMVGVANSQDGYTEDIVNELEVLWLAIGNLIDAQRDHRALLQREAELSTIRQELTIANEQLEGLVRTDGLTNIANRRYFDEVLEEEFSRALRQKLPLALLIFDIDFFKLFNDHYGHQEGDQCLIKVAQTAKQVFQRAVDTVARYGGEEFAVIIPYAIEGSVEKMAERLLEAIRELGVLHELSSVADVVTVSIGFASMVPDVENRADELVMMADKALYEAKQSGRNRFQSAGH